MKKLATGELLEGIHGGYSITTFGFCKLAGFGGSGSRVFLPQPEEGAVRVRASFRKVALVAVAAQQLAACQHDPKPWFAENLNPLSSRAKVTKFPAHEIRAAIGWSTWTPRQD